MFAPSLTGHESKYLERALTELSLSGTSPIVQEFENAFAKFIGAGDCVAVSNGTDALVVAVQALGAGPGDEIILPNSTIISDALAITAAGATPVFVDVNESDWCLNVHEVEAKITSKTKGIIAVHLFGQSCDIDTLKELSEKNNLWLIEDAAQAMSTLWRGKKVGTFGDLGVYSFYANKLMTTGEGGAVVIPEGHSRRKELKESLNCLRNLAFDPHPAKRFIHQTLSGNHRISGLQAAFGLGQLSGISELIKARETLRIQYHEALSAVDGIRIPEPHLMATPSLWMMAVSWSADRGRLAGEVADHLSAVGIETRRLFYPLNRQPALSNYHRQADESFPISDALFEYGLYLPSFPGLTQEQVQHVVKELTIALDPKRTALL